MSKPTVLQTLLGRPSQSYTSRFSQDKDYHSTKAHMLHVAAQAAQQTPGVSSTTISHLSAKVTNTIQDSHVINSPHNCQVEPAADDEDEVYYTPESSPMVSSRELTIATRTPLTSRSTTASISTNSLDGHSLFSLDSSSTCITTPNVSEISHNSLTTKSLRKRDSRRPHPDRTQPASMTYTDQDWAKDVRWLASPPSSISSKSSKKKSKSTTISATSYYINQLPPKIIPQPHPIPQYRTKPRSKSLSKASPSIMMSMSALVEEEEERESIHRSSLGSIRSSSAERARTSSATGSVRPRTSSSLRRQNNPTKPNLAHRKSRSLENIQHVVARASLPDSTVSSYISTTSYAPSLPSSGTPGYTSLTIPHAPQPAFIPNSSKRVSVVGGTDGKIDLTESGIAQTTMATVEVTKGLASISKGGVFGLGAILSRARSRSAKVVGTGATAAETPPRRTRKAGADAVLSFTSYRRPPDYIPAGGVLVQVWAVGVDGVDAKLAGVVHSRTAAFSRPSTAGRSASETGNTPPSKPTLFRSVSMRSKHKRADSDDLSFGGKTSDRIEPDVGYIPGRSFVGRVLECGWDVKDEIAKKGEWVVGLLDVKKCGALQEFIVVDRRRVHKIPHPMIPSSSVLSDNGLDAPSSVSSSTPSRSKSLSRTARPPGLVFSSPLTIDEYALLPLCGVYAYRAVRTLAYAFGKPATSSAEPSSPVLRKPINEHGEEGHRRRALVLNGHNGVGAMAVQMLVRRGWRVCVHATLSDPNLVEGSQEERAYMESVERRVRKWGAEEVVFDDGGGGDTPGEGSEDGVAAVVRVIERLVGDGDIFDAVLDTVGGKEIWEASERLLRNTGVSAPDPPMLSSPGSKSGSFRIRKKNKEAVVQGNPAHGTGQFTTLVGDTPSRPIPTAGDHFRAGLRSLKNTHNMAGDGGNANGNGKVGYAWVSVAQDVDWEGEDVGESVAAVIKMAMNEGVRPWVGGGYDDCDRVVPLERTPQVFIANGPLRDGGTVVVKIVE
ncbi:hypothetical protein BDP27DRAFT_1446094 [Rhodocollybia butyracea]|uniref:Cyclic nucleotide-binding domain-containing protein n=1 Tax=Rhodocollybia butyracea TaxID=206335 RepID=A0A9P5UBA1_9AGAR|nr:hypothetical protein BDP27DRAFT_1446094 [Rhodocollybia butyracea]